MEIIQNTPESYREMLLSALTVNNLSLLKTLNAGKHSDRFVFLNTLYGLKRYSKEQSTNDCVIYSEQVKNKLEDDWFLSVFNRNPKLPPYGFIPSMGADEIWRIYDQIKARIE